MEDISIVIPNWEFGKSGGSRVKSMLANEFHRKGHKVKFLCYYKSNEPYYPVDCEIEYVDEKGNAVERDSEVKPNSILSSFLNVYKRHQALLKGMNRLSGEYNTAIANMAMTAPCVSKSQIKNKYYYIQAYEAWEDGAKSIKNFFWDLRIKKTYKLPLIRIVNADIYRNYKEIHSDYVVPPGLDLNIYYPRNKYWEQDRPIVVGCIGRKEEWKGSNDVGCAIDILHNKGVKVDLLVAFNEIECEDYKLVRPDGDNNLAEYYRNIDILVAPPKLQLGAIHYPVIESMACGTPIVTTGFYPANADNAYIVPVSSPQSIADTIEGILNNYDLAIQKAKKALKEIKRFDWDAVSDSMIEIIKKTGDF